MACLQQKFISFPTQFVDVFIVMCKAQKASENEVESVMEGGGEILFTSSLSNQFFLPLSFVIFLDARPYSSLFVSGFNFMGNLFERKIFDTSWDGFLSCFIYVM